MTAVIDRNLIEKVTAYSNNALALDTLISDIQNSPNSQIVICSLMNELALLSANNSQVLRINYTQRVVTLYESLDALLISHLGQEAISGEKKSAPTGTTASTLLTDLFTATANELTVECFEPIKTLFPKKEALSLTLRCKTPSMLNSLKAAQEALAPIDALIVDFEYSEEALLAIIEACPKLTRLTVNGCSGFTDAVLQKVPATLTVLRAKSTSITDKGIQELCTRTPELCTLLVDDCDQADFAGLMAASYPATLVDFSYKPCWTAMVEKKIVSGGLWKSVKIKMVPKNNLDTIRAAVEHNPDSPVALTMAAVALLESPEPEKVNAKLWLEKALHLNGHFLPAAVAYADLLREGTYQVSANPKEGQRLVDKLLRDFPEHPRLLACKARFLIDQKKYDEACRYAQDAYRESPYDDFVLATYADVLRRKNNVLLASVLCERAIGHNCNNSYAITCKAILNETADPAKAKALFKQAIALHPYNESALVGLAHLLIMENIVDGNHKEAIGLLFTALQANPHSSRAHFALAQVYVKLGQPDNADKHFAAAYENDPKDALILKQYAEFLRETNPDKSAGLLDLAKSAQDLDLQPQVKKRRDVVEVEVDELTKLEDAYPQNPNDPALLMRLGQLLLPIDCERAVEYLESVKTVDSCVLLAIHFAIEKPHDAEVILNSIPEDAYTVDVDLAWANFWLLRGSLDDAERHIGAILQRDPENVQAQILHVRALMFEDALPEEESSNEAQGVNAEEESSSEAQGVETLDEAPMQLEEDETNLKEANVLLTSIITGEKITPRNCFDIIVLLCEYPTLLGDGRAKALALLQQRATANLRPE